MCLFVCLEFRPVLGKFLNLEWQRVALMVQEETFKTFDKLIAFGYVPPLCFKVHQLLLDHGISSSSGSSLTLFRTLTAQPYVLTQLLKHEPLLALNLIMGPRRVPTTD